MKIRKAFNYLIIGFICLITMSTIARCEYDFFDDIVNNPYRELRLPPWSTMTQIKQRYKELVKAYHPDKTKNRHAHDKFFVIQAAYERIKNRRKSEEINGIRYDHYEIELEEESNPFYEAISDTIKIISGCGVSMSLIYFVAWIFYKFFAIIYAPLLTMISSFVICDRMFPHYFKNFDNQIIYSFLFGICGIFYKTIFNALVKLIFGKNVVDSNKKE